MSGLQTRIAMAILIVLAVLVVLTNQSPHRTQTYEVRAIFDNAAFAVPGEDVRIAGAPIGSIKSLDVTPDKRAAVTLKITDPGFTPFHADAHCSIRPAVADRRAIRRLHPRLRRARRPWPKITCGRGSGNATCSRSPAPARRSIRDIVQSIYREPMRQRFALIINELGTGLAARGSDLNDGDPPRRSRARLHRPGAPDPGRAEPSAGAAGHRFGHRARTAGPGCASQLAGFIIQANTTSVASATPRGRDLGSFRLFPAFLRQLRPLMVELGQTGRAGHTADGLLAPERTGAGAAVPEPRCRSPRLRDPP